MRLALVPKSLPPMRDNERRSTRLCSPWGVTRTTTSYITKAIKRDFAFGVPILEAARMATGGGMQGRPRQTRKRRVAPAE